MKKEVTDSTSQSWTNLIKFKFQCTSLLWIHIWSGNRASLSPVMQNSFGKESYRELSLHQTSYQKLVWEPSPTTRTKLEKASQPTSSFSEEDSHDEGSSSGEGNSGEGSSDEDSSDVALWSSALCFFCYVGKGDDCHRLKGLQNVRRTLVKVLICSAWQDVSEATRGNCILSIGFCFVWRWTVG
jgi:hypothetical protein